MSNSPTLPESSNPDQNQNESKMTDEKRIRIESEPEPEPSGKIDQVVITQFLSEYKKCSTELAQKVDQLIKAEDLDEWMKKNSQKSKEEYEPSEEFGEYDIYRRPTPESKALYEKVRAIATNMNYKSNDDRTFHAYDFLEGNGICPKSIATFISLRKIQRNITLTYGRIYAYHLKECTPIEISLTASDFLTEIEKAEASVSNEEAKVDL